MSAPISVTEIPQAYLFGQNSGSNVQGTEQPAEKRNLHRSSGQSILALISQILSQLREYVSLMRDAFLTTAARLAGENMRYAFNALEQRKASAEKELSAKQTVCTAQIFAGCATIAFAVAGGAAAKFFKRNGEAVLGTAMLSSGVGGGASNIITSSTEASQAGKRTQAQILEAEAATKGQLLPVQDGIKSQQWNLGEQMSGQFREINMMVADVYRSFGRLFETPIV